jgi:hypothetical protein
MVLPCFWCRLHFSQVLAEYPIPDTEVFKWSVDVHNLVNERLGKPVVSFEEALTHWSSGCEIEPAEEPIPPKLLFDRTDILLIVLLLALIFITLLKNFRK